MKPISTLTILLFISYHFSSAQSIQQGVDLKSQSNIQEGIELIQTERWQEAISKFDKAISENEWNAEAYYHRGWAKYKMNDTINGCLDLSLAVYYRYKDAVKKVNEFCHGKIVVDADTLSANLFDEGEKKSEIKKDAPGNDSKSLNEVMPSFPGGENEMVRFLGSNIKYPKEARKKNVSGRVFIRFYINKNGKVSRPYVMRGIGFGCDEEALRVVKMMPDWKPGTQNGKPVPVNFNLPINFKLQ